MMTSFDHESTKNRACFQQKTEHDLFPICHGNVKGKHEEDDDDDGDDYEDDGGYEDEDG